MSKPKEELPVFSGDLRANLPPGVATVFFGLAISREVMSPGAPLVLARPREKVVPIMAGAAVSPHIVDLKPAGAALAPTRTPLDFEQKTALFVHRLKRTFAPGAADQDLQAMVHGYGPAVVEAPVQKVQIAAPKPQAAAAKPQPVNPEPLPAVEKPRLPIGMTHDTLVANVRKLEALMRPVKRTSTPTVIRHTSNVKSTPSAIRTPFDDLPENSMLPAKRPHWFRQVVSFAAVAVVIALPLHLIASYAGIMRDASTVSAKTRQAFEQLKTGKFDNAAESFADTRSHLHDATLAIAAFAAGEGDKLSGGNRLLSAGEALSKAGAAIAAAFETLDGEKDARVTDRIKALTDGLIVAEPHLNEAVRELDGISADSVPEEHRALFEAVRQDLRSVRENTHRFIKSSGLVTELLGAGGKRRYLVVFQNDRELRPTGGFIGSFALMDVEDGEIMNVEIPSGGSYDLRWGLNERLAAPEQLRLVNNRWEFQDANWFADFPTSARTLMWFYEKSGGPTVDGVVAVNARLMESLLKQLGPVEMPEYGKTITDTNFYIETQKAVELEYDKEENKPKQFVADMAPKVLQKLLGGNKEDLLPLMNSLSAGFTSKDMMLWFRDEDQQAAASEYGWTGELKNLPDADFLAVIDSNIAGGKTDGVIASDIRHETRLEEGGDIVDTVSVRRTHGGKNGELFSGIKNIVYVRLYVPAGSELLSAEGFEKPGEGYFMRVDETLKPAPLLAAAEGHSFVHEQSGTRITQESGFTVFGNWVQLEPGESKAYRVSYRLPYRFDRFVSEPETWWERTLDKVNAFVPTADLRLVVKKQSGAANRTFTSVIRPPAGWTVSGRVPPEGAGDLDRDLYYGTVLIKND